MQKLVTIIIPVYNGSDFVREAIDSALGQDYPNIEVVVINDGSKDEGRTDAICRGYGEKIRYFAKENGGVSSALNAGVDHAKGELICWLSHDDVYPKDRVSRQAARFEEIGRKDVILYGDYEIMDASGKVYDVFRNPDVPPATFFESIVTHKHFTSLTKWSPFFINGCTLMIPKEAFDRMGRFDETLRTTQDYDMWERMCTEYDFIHMDDLLLRSRRHANQGTRTMYRKMMVESERIALEAIGKYDPSNPRRNLDIARTAFAMRISMNNTQAFKVAMRKTFEKKRKTGSDAYYILRSFLWNKYCTYAMLLIRLVKLELRRMMAK